MYLLCQRTGLCIECLQTLSMLISTVVAVRKKAISKLSAMAWALGACGNPFLYITRTYIYFNNVFNENRIDYIFMKYDRVVWDDRKFVST